MGRPEDVLRRRGQAKQAEQAEKARERQERQTTAQRRYDAETERLRLEIHLAIDQLVDELDRRDWPDGELKTVVTVTPRRFRHDLRASTQLAAYPFTFFYGGDWDQCGSYVCLHVGSDRELYDFEHGRHGRLREGNHDGWGLNVFLKALAAALQRASEDLTAGT